MKRNIRKIWIFTRPSFFVQFADQGEGKKGPHILEMGSDLQAYPVPARISLNILYGDLGLTQRSSAPYPGPGIIHIRHVLANPVV